MLPGRLSAPDFVVCTSSGKVLAVHADSFNAPDPSNPGGTTLLVEAPSSNITDMAAHPLRSELLLLASAAATSASSQGPSTAAVPGSQKQQQQAFEQQQLLRWDLVQRCCIASRQLPTEQHVVRMVMSRDGSFVVLGCAAGHVAVLQGDSLQDVVLLRHTKHEICRWVGGIRRACSGVCVWTCLPDSRWLCISCDAVHALSGLLQCVSYSVVACECHPTLGAAAAPLTIDSTPACSLAVYACHVTKTTYLRD